MCFYKILYETSIIGPTVVLTVRHWAADVGDPGLVPIQVLCQTFPISLISLSISRPLYMSYEQLTDLVLISLICGGFSLGF